MVDLSLADQSKHVAMKCSSSGPLGHNIFNFVGVVIPLFAHCESLLYAPSAREENPALLSYLRVLTAMFGKGRQVDKCMPSA